MNPRDRVTDQGGPAITLRSQVLRRGITFGSRYEVTESPDNSERGLLFLAYQTSIEQQFELLSRKWMNRPNAPEASSGHDLLVGQEHGTRTARFPSPGLGTVEISTDRVWVVPTGGGYFFSPSVSVLEAIASERSAPLRIARNLVDTRSSQRQVSRDAPGSRCRSTDAARRAVRRRCGP